ncbi:MAG: type III secretion system export apparatus subunit SctU [Pseudomonadales bacterium]|nr:type III secretion system export apparatus subunit SctU [Pseudomonadales bacterium]
MSSEKGSDKTEKPTPKKLKDSRKDGEIHKSQDLSKTAMLLLWLLLFLAFSNYLIEQMQVLLFAILQAISRSTLSGLVDMLGFSSIVLLKILTPLLLISSVVAVLVELMQVGVLVTFKKLTPKISHLNPAQGVKKIFSLKNLVELVKSIVKTIVLLLVAYIVVTASFSGYMSLTYGPLEAAISQYRQSLIWLSSGVIFVFFFISVLDVVYQRYEYIKNLKMSVHDIKQEAKSSEGDPMLKSQRKQLHQEWSEQQVIASVRQSSVVVTNPTHIAVALRYVMDDTELPVVMVKGETYLATLIRKTAEEEGIPIMRNVDLARGLYFNVEESDYISAEFFEAVGEVLRWVDTLEDESSLP